MDDGRSFNDRLAFLRDFDPVLAENLAWAAKVAHDDRRSALVCLRSFADNVVRRHLVPTSGQANGRHEDLAALIRQADGSGVFPRSVIDGLRSLKDAGNFGAHPDYCPDPRVPEVDLLRRAWNIAEWLYVERGNKAEHVPSFEPPTAADGNAVFREAVLGGAYGQGDPKAKYFVAKAILAQRDAIIREGRKKGSFELINRLPEVLKLLREAANEVPAARSEFAVLQLMEKSPTEDERDEALCWLGRGEEDDDPNSLFLLGYLSLEGKHGAAVDVAKAAELFERAAGQGEPRSLNALAMLYREGKGVAPDPERAREYARRSAEAGFPIGQHQYGGFLLSGFGGPPNKAEGLVWIRRAIRQDWPDAMYHLARLILDGEAKPAAGENAEGLLAAACRGDCCDARVWRAERELKNPDNQVDFSAAINDLTFAALDRRPEAATDARSKLGAAHRRLEAYLLTLPRTSEKRRDLSCLWYQFTNDGDQKFDGPHDLARHTMGMEQGADGVARVSDASMLNLLRMQNGPGVSELELQSQFTEMKRRLAEADRKEHQKPARSAQVPGRNEPCTCGSGKKFKKCCGSGN